MALGKDSLEVAAGEGLTLELNGETYEISPFTVGDVSALRKHIKSQRVQEFIENSKELPSEDRQKIIMELSKPVTDEEMDLEASSLEGFKFLILQSLKRTNPNLKEEDINEMLTNEMKKEEGALIAAMNGLNGGGEEKSPLVEAEKS